MILKINSDNFFELIKKTYSADHILILKMIEEGIDVNSLCESSERFAALHTSLIRKGLISDVDNKITLIGKDLLIFAESEEGEFVKTKPSEDGFEKWWNAYPKIDSFVYEGKKFEGSRGLKLKKEDCRIKFNKILMEGEISVEDMIRALEYEVKLKIKKSVETGQNKLSYMQNSLTYLNQRTYENFLEISKIQKIEETKLYNGTDI